MFLVAPGFFYHTSNIIRVPTPCIGSLRYPATGTSVNLQIHPIAQLRYPTTLQRDFRPLPFYTNSHRLHEPSFLPPLTSAELSTLFLFRNYTCRNSRIASVTIRDHCVCQICDKSMVLFPVMFITTSKIFRGIWGV